MPIELISTGSNSPVISLDALLSLPPVRSSDALLIPPHRVPGTIANNDVISANLTQNIIEMTPAPTRPTTTPPLVTGTLAVVSPTPDLPRGDWEARVEADRDLLLHLDLLGKVSTEGTPPDAFHNDATVGAVMSLENAHTDQEIFKPSDRPKHVADHLLDKMAVVLEQWEEQVSKATPYAPSILDPRFGLLPLTPVPDTKNGTNAAQLPSSQPDQNLATVYALMQSQIAIQKMAEATSSFMHALDAGEVSVKPIGCPGPFVPLASPSFLQSRLL